MNKFLLAGAAIVFAGIATTVAVAADHKSKPMAPPSRAAVITPVKADHKAPPAKKHHKKHHVHAVKKAHSK